MEILLSFPRWETINTSYLPQADLEWRGTSETTWRLDADNIFGVGRNDMGEFTLITDGSAHQFNIVTLLGTLFGHRKMSSNAMALGCHGSQPRHLLCACAQRKAVGSPYLSCGCVSIIIMPLPPTITSDLDGLVEYVICLLCSLPPPSTTTAHLAHQGTSTNHIDRIDRYSFNFQRSLPTSHSSPSSPLPPLLPLSLPWLSFAGEFMLPYLGAGVPCTTPCSEVIDR